MIISIDAAQEYGSLHDLIIYYNDYNITIIYLYIYIAMIIVIDV
jgi:hypothetical protein